MAQIQETLEIERVVNLVRAFGWAKIKEEKDGNILRLTFEKTIPQESSAG